jgi:hypothetical protein
MLTDSSDMLDGWMDGYNLEQMLFATSSSLQLQCVSLYPMLSGRATYEYLLNMYIAIFTDREQVRMNHQEFDGLPLWLLWCLVVATVLVYLGGMLASGPLKRISVADAPQYVLFDLVSDFFKLCFKYKRRMGLNFA